MTAAKTPPDRVRLTPAQMTRALEMCREQLSAVEKRERALRRMLAEHICGCGRAECEKVQAALAAADEGEKKP